MTLYRISEGSAGSAFKHVGDFTLPDFPASLYHIALYLGKFPQIVDVALTDDEGKHVIVRKADAAEKSA